MDSVFYWIGVATALLGATIVVGLLAMAASHYAWKAYKEAKSWSVVLQAIREYQGKYQDKQRKEDEE